MTSSRSGAAIRAELGHPILDADGHLVEVTTAVLPFLREHMEPSDFQFFVEHGSPLAAGLRYRSNEERLASRAPQSAWWGQHTKNTLDRATAMFPGLLHQRLEEVGVDFGVFYTTSAMGFLAIESDSLRQGLCAGWNAFLAAIESPYRDRIAVAGLIPMHTPEEAIAEMRHCHQLGLRAIAFPEGVLRLIPTPDRTEPSPFLWPGQTHWFDTFGLDSALDYDPVWAATAELGYPVVFHGGLGLKPGVWTSTSNYSANHIGLFGQLMNAVCKSLYFGGVTRRFPGHPFVFLECGVSWGAQMLADIVEHWHKRRLDSLDAYNPALLDTDELHALFDRYGTDLAPHLVGVDLGGLFKGLATGRAPDQPDDWLALAADDEESIVDAFVDSFYFGCEADDRGVGAAFAPTNPRGAVLRPVFSSDIGHWDVTDIGGLVGESRELVEDGVITEEQYRLFTFENTARMYMSANPHFFDGTTVESQVAELRPDHAGADITR